MGASGDMTGQTRPETANSTGEDTKSKPLRLSGWKEIGTFLGKDARTAKRWAAERGMPVHRVPGKGSASVYALPTEIGAWLTPSALPSPAEDMSQAGVLSEKTDLKNPNGLRWAGLLAVVMLLGLPAIFVSGSKNESHQVNTRASDALPENVYALYRSAGYLWPKRTRESLLEAERLLRRVVYLAPQFADANVDLATVYNLMVEYHVKPAEEGYGLSLAAAKRAIEINPQQAAALTVLGDLSYYWQKKYDEAFGYFGRAVEADPLNAQARQWYASALMTSGRLNEAMSQIRKARDIQPESRSIIVSQAMIELGMGDAKSARSALLKLLHTEISYRNPYRFLLFAELAERDMPAYLATMRDWFELIDSPSGKIVAAAADAGWRMGGEKSMIEAMANAANRHHVQDELEQYFRAHVLALANDWPKAVDQLKRTPTRHAFYYSIDPAFDEARGDPEFLRKIAELGLPVVPSKGF